LHWLQPLGEIRLFSRPKTQTQQQPLELEIDDKELTREESHQHCGGT
jgi:hypothetical protein